ncbi:MAG TPA: class I SAM-dependent methyltransferase [Bryobacteraceae bacterium]
MNLVEIGSWAGASTVTWALAIEAAKFRASIFCIDPWKAYFDLENDTDETYHEMNAATEDDKIFRLFEHNIRCTGIVEKVTVRRGTSREILPQLPAKSFDIVYIDGSHRFADVLHDIQEAKRLLREDGIICGDDLELEAGDLDPDELRKTVASGRDYVFSDAHQIYYHPGVTAAVAEEFASVGVWNGFWAARGCEAEWAVPALDVSDIRMPVHIQASFADLRAGAVTLVGEIRDHNIVSVERFLPNPVKQYFAIAKSLGPTNLFQERLGERELPPVLLAGDGIEEVRRKVEELGVIGSNGLEESAGLRLHGPLLAQAAKTLGREAFQYPDVESAAVWVSYASSIPNPPLEASLPDFLGIGPPKTGTHWLASHLGLHPAIFIPPQKELNHFNRQWQFENIEKYAQHFRAAGSRCKGEFSPGYAALPSIAIRAIQKLVPKLKLIFLARRLPERAWSSTRHSWRYRQMTFCNRTNDSLSEAPAAEIAADFLADYALIPSDYEGILRRWLQFFPIEQFHVRYFEEAVAHPSEYLRDLVQFLGLAGELPVEGATPVNPGIDAALPAWAGPFLENLFAGRHLRLEAFLSRAFGLKPVWRPPEQTAQDSVWIEDREDDWRIRLRDGIFEATQSDTARQLHSNFLGDIRLRIDRENGSVPPIGALSEEDELLVAIPDYDNHAQGAETGCPDPPQLIGDHRGFNLVQFRGKIYAPRQTLGEIDWDAGAEALQNWYAPRDFLIGDSAGEVRARIDLQDDQKT